MWPLFRPMSVGYAAPQPRVDCGGGEGKDGLTGADIVGLVRLCNNCGNGGDGNGNGNNNINGGNNANNGGFKGVYTAPQLEALDAREVAPRKKKETRSIMVVNVGAHWVTICLDAEFLLYLDSYGLPPGLPSVREFMHRCAMWMGVDTGEKMFYNGRRVQAWGSNYCGLFAVLWTLCLDMTSAEASADRRRAVEDAKIKFYHAKAKLRANDSLCARYVRKLGESNCESR